MSANINCITNCCDTSITCLDRVHNAGDGIVTASGAADGNCNDCEVANGSHTIPLQLHPVNGSCLWTKNIETSCSHAPSGPGFKVWWSYDFTFRFEDAGGGMDDWYVTAHVNLFSFNSSSGFQNALGTETWEELWTTVPTGDPVDMSTLSGLSLTRISAEVTPTVCDFPTAVSVGAA